VSDDDAEDTVTVPDEDADDTADEFWNKCPVQFIIRLLDGLHVFSINNCDFCNVNVADYLIFS
jgi:hypothetical protein